MSSCNKRHHALGEKFSFKLIVELLTQPNSKMGSNFALLLIFLLCKGFFNEAAAANQVNFEWTANATDPNSLDLGYVKEGTLEKFTMPFAAVESLSFNILAIKIGKVVPFSKLFPNLRQLKMRLNAKGESFDLIDHMPKLEKLDVITAKE